MYVCMYVECVLYVMLLVYAICVDLPTRCATVW